MAQDYLGFQAAGHCIPGSQDTDTLKCEPAECFEQCSARAPFSRVVDHVVTYHAAKYPFPGAAAAQKGTCQGQQQQKAKSPIQSVQKGAAKRRKLASQCNGLLPEIRAGKEVDSPGKSPTDEQKSAQRRERLEESQRKYAVLLRRQAEKQQRAEERRKRDAEQQLEVLKTLKRQMASDLEKQRAALRRGVRRLKVYEGFEPRQ